MDIKDLRRMNLVGTIFFALFGLISVSNSFFHILSSIEHYPKGYTYDFPSELKLTIFLFSIIIVISLFLYRYTVIGLDRGNYKAVKYFTIIGIIVGWIGWIIPSIIFFKSYRAFDDAIMHDSKTENRNTTVL